jgi:hypothetical protein
MPRKTGTRSFLALLGLAAITSLLVPSLPQTAAAQATQPAASTHAIPIEHYYWHFLVHQNQLDHSAALMKPGKDSDWMRNHHQRSLGFTDAEYTAVRTSSTRLANELAVLNQRAAALSAMHVGLLGSSQFRQLSNQRTANINEEVASLRQTLPPEKIAALEAYMVQFFTHSTKEVK